MVATDLAGRGLDVEGINYVINYDAPRSIEAYVHRAGRTGRAGRKGKAVTFIVEEDGALFYDLNKFLKNNGQKVPQELKNHPMSQVKAKAGVGYGSDRYVVQEEVKPQKRFLDY